MKTYTFTIHVWISFVLIREGFWWIWKVVFNRAFEFAFEKQTAYISFPHSEISLNVIDILKKSILKIHSHIIYIANHENIML